MPCLCLKTPLIERPFGLAVPLLCAFPAQTALFGKHGGVRVEDIKQRFARHCEFALFWGLQTHSGGCGRNYFPGRSKHRGVGLLGGGKQLTSELIKGRQRDADRCIVLEKGLLLALHETGSKASLLLSAGPGPKGGRRQGCQDF